MVMLKGFASPNHYTLTNLLLIFQSFEPVTSSSRQRGLTMYHHIISFGEKGGGGGRGEVKSARLHKIQVIVDLKALNSIHVLAYHVIPIDGGPCFTV